MSATQDLATLETPGTRTGTDPFGLSEHRRRAIGLFLDGVIDAESFVTEVGEPEWGPIGREVFERTYARPILEDGKPTGTKESWAEMVRRVTLGNLSFAPEDTQLPDEPVDLFAAIYWHRAIPAGRHLWVTGSPVAKYSRNCWISAWERRLSGHFRFLAARLFEGGGVGANYSSDLLASTAPVVGTVTCRFTVRHDHEDFDAIIEAAGDAFVEHPSTSGAQHAGWSRVSVADSREGWTDLFAQVVDAVTFADDTRLLVDVSEVRPYGHPLVTFGGTASGPAPLVKAVRGIESVLSGVKDRRITGLEAMQIDHEIASSVVAGGARRSARLAAMHWSDSEIFDFINCKSDSQSHWTANISVEVDSAFTEALDAGEAHATAVLEAVAEGMARNGEPGFIDTELASADEPSPVRISNPCGEVFLSSADAIGARSAAGESCNLGSVNLDAFGTDEAGAVAAFELLARFLYRSTENRHADPEAWQVENRNRRIGVGVMGMQGWCAAHGHRLTDFADSPRLRSKFETFSAAARRAADGLADSLGTPRSVKVTAVAPTGTIAQMPGVTAGIHPVFARRFIRRVRFADSDSGWRDAEAKGLNVVDDTFAASTKVVEYLVQDRILERFPENLIEQSDEVSFEQFCALVEAVQSTLCGDGNGNAVSATGSIPVGTDPAELAQTVRKYLGRMKGITVFPDESFELSPMERLSRERYAFLSAAGAIASSGGDSNDGNCDTGGCPIR